ncbi:cupin-like domain-containing protein [Hirschia litorea]|uniref:Cupin-like domain-containing protein n=1 Tax=Hirschia litorea TaxID=1199156 RepID=A0ABW2IPJ8_9PROT
MLNTKNTVEQLKIESVDQFRREVLGASVPKLLKGFVSEWKIVRQAKDAHALFGYLKKFDSKKEVDVLAGRPEIEGKFFYKEGYKELNFEKKRGLVTDVLDQILENLKVQGGSTYYLQSLSVNEFFQGLAQENPIGILPPQIEPRIWIGNALTVQTHFDLSDNLACVVEGTKKFTLFPPEQTANLYLGPLEFTLSGPPVSLVDVEAPDYKKYPRYKEAESKAIIAEVEQGDALYVPYFWWHHVKSTAPINVMINYWWSDAKADLSSPFDALLLSLLSIKGLPDRYKYAWQQMFQSLVFSQSHDAGAHLPEDVRGVLGALNGREISERKARLARKLAIEAGVAKG